jgi:hypothetical protein
LHGEGGDLRQSFRQFVTFLNDEVAQLIELKRRTLQWNLHRQHFLNCVCGS